MSSESTPTDSRSPPEPGRIPQTPLDHARDSSFDRRVEILKQEVAFTLRNTEWPKDSASAAEELLNTINSSPKITNKTNRMTHEVQLLVERYAEVLDDVRIRLKEASSKSEMKRWKLLERVRSLASNRPSKCTLLFKTCQDDVSKVTHVMIERLDCDVAKEKVFDGSESLSQAQLHPVQPLESDPSTGISRHGALVDDSTTNSPSSEQPQSDPPEDRRKRSPVSDTALNIARRTFKSVDIVSGAIPVAGSYVGAVARVGLAFVEMLKTMDRNHDVAVDLGDHTSKLTKLLENFKKKSSTDEQDITGQITSLHEELGRVKEKIEEWSSLGKFKKAFSSSDHSESLREYQGIIQTVQEEMQLLVSIDSRNMIVELENIELRKERRRLLQCLGDGQYGAQGNTIEDVVCFPGTRLDVLDQVETWIKGASITSRVLWICGMAGRGKSTIASTVVHNWKSRASCAIFHFRRGQSTVNSRVLCALARQLASSLVPELREVVLGSVQENEGIAEPGRRLDEQFETLFVIPFEKLKNHPHPILIVMDALDECNNPKDAVDFVRLIHQHSPSFPANVKFLLTCRPENRILRHLESKPWRKENLDLAPDINKDLARFIQNACAQVREIHDLSDDWPSCEDIEQLVQMSQGLFQWARTVVAYIGDGSAVDRLRALLKRPSVWSGLDDLYHQILSKAFDSVRLDPVRQDILRRVLGTLVVAPHPVSLEVIATLYGKHEVFDEAENDRIIPFLRRDVLADLNSLLFIPDSSSESMRLMHTSIQDLLASELRCNYQPFYVDPARCHQELATECFKIMLGSLKENICDLLDISKSSLDVQDIVERVIPNGLAYCCRAWSTHLTQGVRRPVQGESGTTSELVHFETFSKGKIMYWLEVMSLVGATAEAISSAKQMHQWLLLSQLYKHDSLTTLWDDVWRFVTTFFEPISFGPLQIYISALPHCPRETEIWNIYGEHAKVRIIHGQRTSRWPSNLWIRPQTERINTVALSPDGTMLAIGSQDSAVQLLDAQTGTTIGEPLTGHNDTVWSVCFSPNGKLLASGSGDTTIRLWSPESQMPVGEPLTGHSDDVMSVCFSPDGKLLASGSDDKTIRLWNIQTGAVVGKPITEHHESVWSVCFSPNGKLLASGSGDHTIRLWDPQTGVAKMEPLNGHSDGVRCVCISPDGKILASGSSDGTIRLWSTQTGIAMGEPLTGHKGLVLSVCFSPNGNLLASGSSDGTIRLWDIRTGAAFSEPRTGHSNWVWSVCFSPDSKSMASGSDDKTVRLWDPQAGGAEAKSPNNYSANVDCVCFSPDGKHVVSGSSYCAIQFWDTQTGKPVGGPIRGHRGRINAICFSPDGKLLASGSCDGTIRLCDAETGMAVGRPLTVGGWWIRSVCFSPDGKYLATGSNDTTVRLWNPQTGVQVGEPLKGHKDFVMFVCFSPDGKLLASGSKDKTIRLWDPQTRVAVGEPLEGHSDHVISISFSSDGSLLVAQCRDGSLATWDVTTRQRCNTPRIPPSYSNPHIRDHWVEFHYSRFLWLPPQYWDSGTDGIALFGGMLAVFQNESLSILDVSQLLLA